MPNWIENRDFKVWYEQTSTTTTATETTKAWRYSENAKFFILFQMSARYNSLALDSTCYIYYKVQSICKVQHN